jgi:hypothetical protein
MSQTISVSELLDYQMAAKERYTIYTSDKTATRKKAIFFNPGGRYKVFYIQFIQDMAQETETKYEGTSAEEAVEVYNNL